MNRPTGTIIDLNPDYEFDGYAVTGTGKKWLSDVKIWLPFGTHDDGAIEVTVMGRSTGNLDEVTSIEKLVSESPELSFTFEAVEPFIRRASSSCSRRLAGGIRLEIEYLRSWSIHHRLAMDIKRSYLQLTLSALRYGRQPAMVSVDAKGNRKVNFLQPPKLLKLKGCRGEIRSSWYLGSVWNWGKKHEDCNIRAAASPALILAKHVKSANFAELSQMGKEVCLLLSLAARHLVLVYHQHAEDKCGWHDEWFQPLNRPRSTTEEAACGPLVDESELESFFDVAGPVWYVLDVAKKDAIRQAVFAINPVLELTVEARYLSLFSAFEGLVKRWPLNSEEGFCSNFRRFQKCFPIELENNLWPVCKSGIGNLYWLRNEFAHGYSVMRLPVGLISTALDHLQLRIELSLLKIFGFHRQQSRKDWLTNQAIKSREQSTKLIESIQHLIG